MSKAKQTLFEAAKDALDGTRFKLASGTEVIKEKSRLVYTCNRAQDVSIGNLQRTDFEVILVGPVKCKPTDEQRKDLSVAYYNLSAMSMWKGAEIGQPVTKESLICYIPVVFPDKETRDAAYAEVQS